MRPPPSPWTALPGIAVPVAVAVGVLVAGLATPGYDPIRRTVSTLYVTDQPHAVAVAAMVALLGLAVAWSAVPLARAHPRCRAAAAALLVAGAGLVAVAFIARDVTPDARTRVHHALAAAALLALAAAPPLASWALRHVAGTGVLRTAGWAAAACTLALLAIGAAMQLADWPIGGLWERAFTGVNLAWLVTSQTSLVGGRRR